MVDLTCATHSNAGEGVLCKVRSRRSPQERAGDTNGAMHPLPGVGEQQPPMRKRATR